MTPRRAGGEFVAAERADDLRAHLVDLALQRVHALFDLRFLFELRLELGVTPEALDRLHVVALLLEHDRLVVRTGGIGWPQLLRLREELHRVRELAFAVEKLRAIKEVRVLLIGLTLLLQLALKLEL